MTTRMKKTKKMWRTKAISSLQQVPFAARHGYHNSSGKDHAEVRRDSSMSGRHALPYP
jgi:hypothetical protein